MKDLILGKYIPQNSVVHNLDPRAKIVTLLSVVLVTILYNSLYIYLAIILALLLIQLNSKLAPQLLINFLKSFRFFLYITFLIHFLFTPAAEELDILFFHISLKGAQNGIYYSLRLLILIYCGALFSWTTRPIDLTDAIEKLLNPLKRLKVPVRDFSLMMMVALRFIPTFLEEANLIQLAQKARGLKFEGKLRHRLKSLIPLVIPLFVSAFKRAETLAYALEVKGYSSTAPKTCLNPLRLRRQDLIILFIAIFIIFLGVGLKL